MRSGTSDGRRVDTFRALRTLDLSATKVADLTPLKDLPNLTKVNGVADEELKKLNAYRGSINLPLVK
jgi:hypothetical protein